jgi:hypothetical protein
MIVVAGPFVTLVVAYPYSPVVRQDAAIHVTCSPETPSDIG